MEIIRVDSGSIAVVFGALFVAGFAYNLLVGWLERKHYDEGYTAYLVVGGVGFTIIGLAVLNTVMAMIVFVAFAASGFWMVVGSMWRHARKREQAQKAILDEAARLAE